MAKRKRGGERRRESVYVCERGRERERSSEYMVEQRDGKRQSERFENITEKEGSVEMWNNGISVS